MSVDITRKTLKHLPNRKTYDGTITATAIYYDIKPVLILEECPNNQGPQLEMAIDYYAPAAAGRMGLPIDKTRYIVKSEGAFDDEYLEVWLPDLIKDEWGQYHAGDGEVTWGELNIEQFEFILSDLGEPPCQHVGKNGVFMGNDTIIIHRKISGYNGIQYYDLEGKPINGELLRLEGGQSETIH